jgi:DNA-binding transcriptional ArsR family regulator
MSRTMKKAMRLLDLFSLQRPEWGVSEVAKALGFPKSTTSELMSDLADQRLLSRSTKGKYRLGWRLFELSQTLLDTTEFKNEARRVMEELVECWRETVHLAVLDGVQAVYIEKLQPTRLRAADDEDARPAPRARGSNSRVRAQYLVPRPEGAVGGVDAPQDSAADLAVDLLKCRSKAQPGKHASEHRGSSRRIVRTEGTITLRPFRLFTVLQEYPPID